MSISAAIISFVFTLIFFIWYPRPYFQANGAWSVIRILILVDLVMGPLLTLVLFKKGKPGLVLDLCLVAIIQLTALIYGVNV
ncbi:MAG: type IV pilin accessory protein, partial [Gammaproteobacteria bacterium]